MNRSTTKKDLLFYLRDPKVPVIALKGLWGTGKTHLWEEVRTDLVPVEGNDDHLYASCFGLDSVEQIKATLFQNSLGKAERAVSTAKRVSGFAIDVVEKIAAQLVPGAEGAATVLGSLGGLLQSALIDKVLHSRLIVLDDLERRGDGLRIDALLGFIDLLTRSDCKVLVIFNEEPLVEIQTTDWRTLKEKCIHREITLMTEPVEAAEIGLSASLVYRAAVSDALFRFSVTNIRVVQRIDRVVQTLFEGVSDPYGHVAQFMVPAAVLMTALNFNAVPRGPDIQRLIGEWSAWCARPGLSGNTVEGLSDAVAFASNANLTRDLEFLQLVWRHLTTGHRFREEFDVLFEDRRKRAQDNETESSAIRYIEDTYLDPTMNNADFIRRAREYREAWDRISVDKISAIVNDLEGRGALELAQEIANRWAESWKQARQSWNSLLYSIESLHPIIREAIEEGNKLSASRPSLLQAVRQVSTGGWSPKDTETINGASEQEVMAALIALGRDDFGTFIYFYRQELKSPRQSTGVGSLFAPGTATFIRTARRLAGEQPDTRLAELLRSHLGEVLSAAPAQDLGDSAHLPAS